MNLERGNVAAVDEKAAAVRHYLALAETLPAESLRGGALYRREQMELLAGIAEHLAGSIDANLNLLRHLVSLSIPAAQSRANGYTSQAAPIA